VSQRVEQHDELVAGALITPNSLPRSTSMLGKSAAS